MLKKNIKRRNRVVKVEDLVRYETGCCKIHAPTDDDKGTLVYSETVKGWVCLECTKNKMFTPTISIEIMTNYRKYLDNK
jgi:hypothetical protein